MITYEQAISEPVSAAATALTCYRRAANHLALDESASMTPAPDTEIATLASAVCVLVIHTGAELMVARKTVRVLRAASMNDADRRAQR